MKKCVENKNKCLKYFKFFSNKDLNGLEDMFSDEIVLRDWDVFESGKPNVLQVNENIFSIVKSIIINPINMYCDNETVISELEVIINNVERIFVVDIVRFNENGKIANIHAYKR